MTFLLCGTTLTASAASADSEGSELSNIKELLNAISYNEYMKEYTSKGELAKETDGDDSTNPNYFDLVPNAGSEIVLDGLDGVYVNDLGDVLDYDPAEALKPGDATPKEEKPYKFSDGEKEGLFVPDTGTVTWTIDADDENAIKLPTRYSLSIEYYPIANKSAAIERVFMINDEVPFAEARYLTISKVWSVPFPDATIKIEKRMTAADLIAEAKAA
ncbi:MAG: hypothetical protein II373_05445, partial [Clostridia bacterium]|nr:hypothetical protein [Clostridia bacterium]